MKISAERLKKIIKEEVQYVREIATDVEQAVDLDTIHKNIGEVIFQMDGLVHPDAAPGEETAWAEKLAADLQKAADNLLAVAKQIGGEGDSNENH